MCIKQSIGQYHCFRTSINLTCPCMFQGPTVTPAITAPRSSSTASGSQVTVPASVPDLLKYNSSSSNGSSTSAALQSLTPAVPPAPGVQSTPLSASLAQMLGAQTVSMLQGNQLQQFLLVSPAQLGQWAASTQLAQAAAAQPQSAQLAQPQQPPQPQMLLANQVRETVGDGCIYSGSVFYHQ